MHLFVFFDLAHLAKRGDCRRGASSREPNWARPGFGGETDRQTDRETRRTREKERERERERDTHRQTDRQTDRQTHRQ